MRAVIMVQMKSLQNGPIDEVLTVCDENINKSKNTSIVNNNNKENYKRREAIKYEFGRYALIHILLYLYHDQWIPFQRQ